MGLRENLTEEVQALRALRMKRAEPKPKPEKVAKPKTPRKKGGKSSAPQAST